MVPQSRRISCTGILSYETHTLRMPSMPSAKIMALLAGIPSTPEPASKEKVHSKNRFLSTMITCIILIETQLTVRRPSLLEDQG